jgi:hypothetical protein
MWTVKFGEEGLKATDATKKYFKGCLVENFKNC